MLKIHWPEFLLQRRNYGLNFGEISRELVFLQFQLSPAKKTIRHNFVKQCQLWVDNGRRVEILFPIQLASGIAVGNGVVLLCTTTGKPPSMRAVKLWTSFGVLSHESTGGCNLNMEITVAETYFIWMNAISLPRQTRTPPWKTANLKGLCGTKWPSSFTHLSGLNWRQSAPQMASILPIA